MYKLMSMSRDEYRRALDAAIREYEELGKQRLDIDKRLAQLMQTITSLNKLCGFMPTAPMGLTDGCRLALRSGAPMTPREVRDRLEAIGFDLSEYSNALASIHTVLRRLNEAGEIRLMPRDGKPAFVFVHGPRTVVMTKADFDALIGSHKHGDKETR